MANNQFTYKTLEDQVFSRVSPEPNSGCWLWTGSLNDDGYGQMSLNAKMRKSHDVVYRMMKGPVPEGLELDHKCRVRCCVNPDHLEPVTHKENCERGILRERNLGRTHCKRGHPFDGDNLRHDNKGTRICAECSRMRCRQCRERKGLPVGMGRGGNSKKVWARRKGAPVE